MMREKYESLAVHDLKEIAKARGIKGLSTMKKAEVIDAMLRLDAQENAEMKTEPSAPKNRPAERKDAPEKDAAERKDAPKRDAAEREDTPKKEQESASSAMVLIIMDGQEAATTMVRGKILQLQRPMRLRLWQKRRRTV